MLYALKIVLQLADASIDNKKVSKNFEFDSAWRIKFVQLGGLAYLN